MINIDAHQHFWIYNDTDYTWMGPEHASLKRDFTPEELAGHLNAMGFDGSVAVQARLSIQETEWLLSLSERHEDILGVVGWLDLFSPDIPEQINRFGDHPKFKGIRHFEMDDPQGEFMLSENFRHGIRILEAAGLSYDLLITPQQIAYATQLVDQFPNQTFIVNHLANPNIAEGIMSPWDTDLESLARRQNVSCKLSGVAIAATRNCTLSDFRPYFDLVMEAFGSERVMIGSDWPVCTLAADYQAVIGTLLNYVSTLSPSERTQVSGGNCCRIYRIPHVG